MEKIVLLVVALWGFAHLLFLVARNLGNLGYINPVAFFRERKLERQRKAAFWRTVRMPSTSRSVETSAAGINCVNEKTEDYDIPAFLRRGASLPAPDLPQVVKQTTRKSTDTEARFDVVA